MVPCLCGESDLVLAEDANWAFDWEQGLSDRTQAVLTCAIRALALSAIFLVGLLISGFWGVAFVLIAGLSLITLVRHWSGDMKPAAAVRITPVGVCVRSGGQLPMRVVGLALHPLCMVIVLRAHDSQQSTQRRRIVFWRHHFPQQQYRRMTLVVRWLFRGAAHE